MIPYHLKHDIVAETVREWIIEGKYRPGEQLPTDSVLSEQFQMNRRTIGLGLNKLVSENLLERAPRRGTIVKQSATHPMSNAVALVTSSRGDVYADLSRQLNLKLLKLGHYPVLLNHDLVENKAEMTSFLSCMTDHTRPYGILAIGDRRFPYELLEQTPQRFPNTVFMMRYHWPHELPNANYVLTDYEAYGKLIVEYFAQRGVRHILFPALAEKEYAGPWSSMQVRILQSLLHVAPSAGITVDEPLFWRLQGGANVPENLHDALVRLTVPTGIFTWSDYIMTDLVFPVIRHLGKHPQRDFTLLAQFNTPIAQENHFSSFDIQLETITQLAIDMLTNQIADRKVLVLPKIFEH